MNARRPTTPITLQLAPTRRPAQEARRAPAKLEHQIVDVTVQADERLLLSVDEAARRLSIGRSLPYELLAAGEIGSPDASEARSKIVDQASDLRIYLVELRGLEPLTPCLPSKCA